MTNHFLATYVGYCIRKKGVLKQRELQMANVDTVAPSTSSSVHGVDTN